MQPSHKPTPESSCVPGIFQAPAKVKKVDLLSTYSVPCAKSILLFFSFGVNYILMREREGEGGERERDRTPLHGENIVRNKTILRDASYPSG